MLVLVLVLEVEDGYRSDEVLEYGEHDTVERMPICTRDLTEGRCIQGCWAEACLRPESESNGLSCATTATPDSRTTSFEVARL